MTDWHLYLIRTADGSLYTGITTNVARRLAEHREGGARGARYLRGKAPLRLVYQRRLGSKGLALKAERRLKTLPKREKERIVRSNPGRRELVARLGIAARSRSRRASRRLRGQS